MPFFCCKATDEELARLAQEAKRDKRTPPPEEPSVKSKAAPKNRQRPKKHAVAKGLEGDAIETAKKPNKPRGRSAPKAPKPVDPAPPTEQPVKRHRLKSAPSGSSVPGDGEVDRLNKVGWG